MKVASKATLPYNEKPPDKGTILVNNNPIPLIEMGVSATMTLTANDKL